MGARAPARVSRGRLGWSTHSPDESVFDGRAGVSVERDTAVGQEEESVLPLSWGDLEERIDAAGSGGVESIAQLIRDGG